MIVTITTAGICGLIFFALSLRVSSARGKHKVSLGDGGNVELLQRIRAHANFAEFVPMVLILMGLVESSGGNRLLLGIVGVTLILCRIAHAWGMDAPAPNPGRVVGTSGTFLILVMTSVWALIISGKMHGLY